MKKQLLSIALGLVAMLTVTTSFAADTKHSESGKTTVIDNGNKTTVFNSRGKWVYSIQRIAADNLPKDILTVVQNNYGPCYVSGMEKIDQRGLAPVYIVHMQDRKSLKTVRVNVSDGETQLMEDYIKG
ncbi:MAG TPA: hypothetical protein VG738_04025 [Chitinophagaceae bacterium]|nr:hypothetical protein [Chitinophagaceae bacterium]